MIDYGVWRTVSAGYMPNYYPMGQQMPSAMPDQLAQLRQAAYPQQQPAQQSSPIIWVQGEEGAKAYMVAAGNSVLLMDSENSTFTLRPPTPAVCRSPCAF